MSARAGVHATWESFLIDAINAGKLEIDILPIVIAVRLDQSSSSSAPSTTIAEFIVFTVALNAALDSLVPSLSHHRQTFPRVCARKGAPTRRADPRWSAPSAVQVTGPLEGGNGEMTKVKAWAGLLSWVCSALHCRLEPGDSQAYSEPLRIYSLFLASSSLHLAAYYSNKTPWEFQFSTNGRQDSASLILSPHFTIVYPTR
ncbi:hypothetical protein BXZ70DRAFT_501000 [Cristinia sonorae]|uniref:Uncharacterized protein n=1 Tax=Cristinia sonorae TaxID=1940300 RepID=A0A8K0XLB0_9AGAR|nr:hypothetical protein BXZ70DRAFT_501000 [Cristinia sonorae]